MADVKKRFWSFIVYPESAPSNWIDQLIERGLQCAISPLHDRDLMEDGSAKKPHYHVLLAYSNTTTYSNIKSITDSILQPIPKPIDSVKGGYEYLFHKNNPEKAQYSELDIRFLNGFDIESLVELSAKEVNQIIIEVQQFIRDNDIKEYAVLLDVLCDNDMYKQYDVAIHHTILFTAYLRSRRNMGGQTNDR